MKCLHYFCNLLSDWLQWFCQSGFESYRETFQRRKAGTKETIIKYRISSETFKTFAREVQSTLYQTRKDMNYWHTVASIFECLYLSSLTEDSVPNTKASKVFCTADLMLRSYTWLVLCNTIPFIVFLGDVNRDGGVTVENRIFEETAQFS